MPRRTRTRQVERLFTAFDHARHPVILLHDNPDPDAIGSGLALQKLLQAQLQLFPPLVHGGVIARAENRALVAELCVELQQATDYPWSDAERVSIVVFSELGY